LDFLGVFIGRQQVSMSVQFSSVLFTMANTRHSLLAECAYTKLES
jgi:hypothetical protein